MKLMYACAYVPHADLIHLYIIEIHAHHFCVNFTDQMFVFFPDEPKVGIKTIKQWVKHCIIYD